MTKSSALKVGRRTDSSIPLYFACDRRTGKLVDLNDGEFEGVGRIVAAGQFIAYQLLAGGSEGTDEGVFVLNIKHPRDRSAYPAYSGAFTSHEGPFYDLPDLLLSRAGDVAWIAQHAQTDQTREVRYARWRGESRLLDSAPDIPANSLALSRRYIYWQRGGEAQVATR